MEINKDKNAQEGEIDYKGKETTENQNYKEEVTENKLETENLDNAQIQHNFNEDDTKQDEDGGSSELKMDTEPLETYTSPEDYIRNFLMFHGLNKSLDSFQAEWYQLQCLSQNPYDSNQTNLTKWPKYIREVPNLHQENLELRQTIKKVIEDSKTFNKHEEHLRLIIDNYKKERTENLIMLGQYQQEKFELEKKLKTLLKEREGFSKEINDAHLKLMATLKEKSLLKLDRDKKANQNQSLKNQLSSFKKATSEIENNNEFTSETTKPKKETISVKKCVTDNSFKWPRLPKRIESRTTKYPTIIESQSKLLHFKKGHTAAISGVAFSPDSQHLATASDDGSWKLWRVSNAELVLTGSEHQSWLSDICFHPSGKVLATSSGDGTIKLWRTNSDLPFETINHHAQPVWSVCVHPSGQIIGSASMDSTCKVFDFETLKCRQVLKGHTASINSACFLPYSNNICTASRDKTVCVWDLRVGKPCFTLYGHQNSCNHVSCSSQGYTVSSCDTKGYIKLWDLRNINQHVEVYLGPKSANCSTFDESGLNLIVASSSSSINIVNIPDRSKNWSINGHKGSVQAVKFDMSYNYLASTSSDCTFQIWSTQ